VSVCDKMFESLCMNFDDSRLYPGEEMAKFFSVQCNVSLDRI